MEEGQITDFTGEVYNMRDYEKTANKNKAQRANRADKKKLSEQEIKDLKKENKKLQAKLARGRVPDAEDQRGTGQEIDAEHNQLYRARTTPKTTPIKKGEKRFGTAEQQRASAACRKTLEDGLRFNWNRPGETRSHKDKELKVHFIDKNNNRSGNKRSREQPIEEGEDGEWYFVEDGHGIDAQAADVKNSSRDEDQDVFAHSA